MQTKTISVYLPSYLVEFVENYKLTKYCKSRSHVIQLAIKLLRSQELDRGYRAAGEEVDLEWDLTVGDGLSDETW
ncbi:CopG family transcriptional regulator [Anabaenopsis tanganyikae CS-531]|uniref:CopG family transcriptional regulator n=2 Tax=Anabaenopsis TaxID=110103 RepID=A0ABT5ASE5_9CYAN|nr:MULTISPECIES: CopG family transcriptional regulator [Anabaenopsis]MDB9540239.1 CopG family transcriptional regulator [Anabaenopsis arnoldii]MDH6092637.1 CopG family transcriptional regulator [Anabaenopsis arnoldii]MDH6097370.1 CopG family transcriptional regulator [Anabaenopsis sp. FSS-46]MDH6106494.1 CopG family transcriptional regulator [Anabaenopsis tanganyikae CS-531]